MIQYIIECIAFQLVFLIVYDFFLKHETFFQWNRVYLIGTYILSMVLPWIKIEALKNAVPQQFYIYPDNLWGTNDAAIAVSEESTLSVPWESVLLLGGILFAALLFGFKMRQLYRIRKDGEVHFFDDFTKIIIANSSSAFSFFKSIFMGDKILESEQENIIQHELVHIRQGHSIDLLFFEIMRIIAWFNPLVYLYQGKISELHEFIADAHAAKSNKKQQYQLLLSKVFQTQNISFINQFFKSSLIKKRIVMLQKSKSKRIFQLKYLFLVPVLTAMLFYSSCQNEAGQGNTETITVGDIENLTEDETTKVFTKVIDYSVGDLDWLLKVEDKNSTVSFSKAPAGSGISGPGGTMINAKMHIESKVLDDNFSFFDQNGEKPWQVSNNENTVPFGVVEVVPVFPGCENENDLRGCFQKMIHRHISKNFRYPQEAQEKGIQGRVSTMFIIGTDGVISNIKTRGPDKLLEAEAKRLIARLPQMSPGKQMEKAVNVPFSIPITFKLQGDVKVKATKINSKNGINPIYIVDGTETSTEEFQKLNQDNIASMNVLKGHAAIKKYGHNAKNGVIEIKMKKKN